MKKFIGMIAAIMLLASCGVEQSKYDAQVKKVDSLTAVNAKLTKELDGYRYSPAKLLADIRGDYAEKNYDAVEKNLSLMRRYHPDAKEYATAADIYKQGIKDQEDARKKAEAEAAKREAERRAKMKPIERIMEKYDCDEGTAALIHKGQVRIGMTTEQCRAALGRPRDINRSVGSYGVHEQWCYNGLYLYFEDGVMTSFQD